MIVLGIDPGTASLGYGVVDLREGGLASLDHGVLATGPERAMPDRLLAIHRGLVDLLARHRPALVAVERLFFSTNVQTALAVGQARGVVLLAAAEAGLPVREATPNEVKVAVTGSGAADKEQVGRMVATTLGLPGRPTRDDAADALAIAIWGANTARLDAPAAEAPSSVLDRAATAPIAAESPYERAVREALAAESRTGRR